MRRANGLLFKVLRIAVLVYVGVCVLMFFAQRSMIYYPQPRLNRDGVALMRLETEAGAVLVSTRPVTGPDAVIYFGGNAEDTSLALADFEDAFPQAVIYLMHYRGYGGSAGKPSEYPFLPVRLLMRDRYDSWKYAGKVTSPVRMIVAERDEIIPRASTERLRTRFGKTSVSYVVIPGVGHNSISDDAQYWRAVGDGGK